MIILSIPGPSAKGMIYLVIRGPFNYFKNRNRFFRKTLEDKKELG
jgi:hypothetical protein